MSYTKTTWSDRSVQYPRRYKDQFDNQYTFTPDEGTIYNAGVAVIASLMNKIEDGIYNAHVNFDALNTVVKKNSDAAELYYGANKKLATLTDGIAVTGKITLTETLHLADDKQAYFGTDNDMYFKHTGSTGFWVNTTGNSYIQMGSKYALAAIPDGAVKLYYDGSQKFTTYSSGVIVTGAVVADAFYLDDDEPIKMGDGEDFQLYHIASGIHVIKVLGGTDLRIMNDQEYMAKFVPDGAVELYYDNSKKLETNSGGITVTGSVYADGLLIYDSDYIRLGSDQDMFIMHTGGNGYIRNYTGHLHFRDADDNNIVIIGQDGFTAYYNGTVRLQTSSIGAKVIGTFSCDEFSLGDSEYAKFGTDDDLIIWHTGTNGYIKSYTGNLYFQDVDSNNIVSLSQSSFVAYYDGSAKIATSSIGVTVTGIVTCDGVVFGLNEYAIFNNSLRLVATDTEDYIQTQANHPIFITTQNAAETMAKFIPDGACEFYYNNTKVFETTAKGVSFGDHNASFTEHDNGNSGSAKTIDWGLSNKQKSTLTDDCTFTFTAPPAPCNLLLKLIHFGAGRDVTWPATVKWPGGTAPVLSGSADDIDIVTFYYDGSYYYGSYGLDFAVPAA